MENVDVWYLTNNSEGEKLAGAIGALGLKVNIIKEKKFSNANIIENNINIIIVDVSNWNLERIISLLRNDERIKTCLKFVILGKREIKRAVEISLNLIHIEYISRPVNKREFLLLLEKSVIVERYREIISIYSKEAESRIGAFESLMDINRKDVFESEKEKEVFEKILHFENQLIDEQDRLNRAVKEFTFIRQKEMFNTKGGIKAEEMITDLKKARMVESHNVIKTDDAIVEFSPKVLDDNDREINSGGEGKAESDFDKIKLYSDLIKEREKNMKLSEEIDKLKNKGK